MKQKEATNLLIRDATLQDAECIAAYNIAMAGETEGHSLAHDIIHAGVQQLIGNPQLGRYWVAERNREIVGQIMVTYEFSDWRNGVFWWIQSVYVAEASRRSGVFSALYRHVESMANAKSDVVGLRLYVDQENASAQRTYQALGMHDRHYKIMEVEFNNTAKHEEQLDA